MYRIPMCALLLLLVAFAFSQDPQQPSQQNQPASSASQQTPAQQHQEMSEANSRIQRSVEDLLRGDPVLSSADIQVAVDDYSITLTGHVDSYAQHQRVMALLEQYTRYRKIVDKLQMK